MVNDKGILACADNSLTGEVKVTGTIGKGTYQCTWDGDWHPLPYDDYALLASKLAPEATVLNVSEAARWDEDWNVIKAKCPNITIVTSDDPTGIQQLKNTDNHADNKVYTLSGQLCTNTSAKGIYIVNGKKVIKK